jgi:sugar O-acyltransferase (sialic acid O-acetyltransferase NeuD family)
MFLEKSPQAWSSFEVSSKGLVIIGAGGLGVEYAWVADEMNAAADGSGAERPWKILGFADDAAGHKGQTFGSYTVQGTIEESAAAAGGEAVHFAVAVGKNTAREKLVHRAIAAGWLPASLRHPSAIIAGDAQVGEGSYIAPGSIIGPQARVGAYVIVNMHVTLAHHSIVGDYAQISPGATVNGKCRVGRYGFLGSHASLNPGTTVGDGGVVGANSFAIRNVPAGVTVLGCPATAIGTVRPKSSGERTDG